MSLLQPTAQSARSTIETIRNDELDTASVEDLDASEPPVPEKKQQQMPSFVGNLADANSALCIKASVRKNRCQTFCRCQCHRRTHFSTPPWMKSLFGTFFGSFTGYPLLGPWPCDYSRCRQTGRASTQISYFFPAWYVSRVISISTTWKDLTGAGASWTIRMPQPICNDSITWYLIRCDDLSMVRRVFEDNEASAYDMNVDGLTLLHVCMDLSFATIGPALLFNTTLLQVQSFGPVTFGSLEFKSTFTSRRYLMDLH